MNEQTITVLVGDVRERLRHLPDDSVHCVVTSPPYWQLRAYGTEPQAWGGDPGHEHVWAQGTTKRVRFSDPLVDARSSTLGRSRKNPSGMTVETIADQKEGRPEEHGSGDWCDCGAWRGELGQEPHPDLFVEHLVEVFEEVRRVLRPDGVCFVNIDDSYVSTAPGTMGDPLHARGILKGVREETAAARRKFRPLTPDGLKPKDLALVPQRFAIRMQEAGWWVRCDVIWAPADGMPESVTDRPTRTHEYVWVFTKSANYFWDKEAVKEQGKDWSKGGPGVGIKETQHYSDANGGNGGLSDLAARYKDSGRPQSKRAWELFTEHGLTEAHLAAIRAVGITDVGKAQVTQDGYGNNTDEMQRLADEAKKALGGYYREFLFDTSRNIRSVWRIATGSFPGAHFAVMATEVAETCIRAATSEKGCCSNCGSPFVRVVERASLNRNELPADHPEWRPSRYDDGKAGDPRSPGAGQRYSSSKTLGWKPTCKCYYAEGPLHGYERDPAYRKPCTVLDPFLGSGTTAIAARRLGRSAVGVELNEEYAKIANDRIAEWWKDKSVSRAQPDDGQLDLLTSS